MTERRPISDRSAWTASDFPTRRAWGHPLTLAALAEIRQAVDAARARGLAFWEIRKEDFPLPSLEADLEAAYDELEEGHGFAVFTGFPVDDYTYDDALMAYAGIAAHLGKVVQQTHRGDRKIDVADKGLPYDHTSRGYSSNKRLPFHTDGADLVGLLALGTAAEGGLSILVSASSVYNAILAERPDLLEVLERGFHHHRRGEQGPGEPPVSASRIPVFGFHEGLLHCCYNRNPIEWATKEGVVLSAREVEALDFFDSVVHRPGLQIEMDLQRGDIQFVNNYIVLHSRTDYRDDAAHRRHLVRLWVNVPESKRAGPTLLLLYAPHVARQRDAA